MNVKLCTVVDCTKTSRTRGWCPKHYSRWLRHGSTSTVIHHRYDDPEEAFAARTVWRGGCLEWLGQVNNNGYGVIYNGAKDEYTHRYAFRRVYGDIPEGKMVDHRCHNSACCHIGHLRLASNKQNQENRVGAQSNSKSGIRGVFWRKDLQKWCVVVQHLGKQHYGGIYKDLEDAGRAASELRNKLFTFNDKDRI